MGVWSNNDFFLDGPPQIVREAAAILASTDLFPDDEPQVGDEIDFENGDIRIKVLTSGYGWPDIEDELRDLSRRGLRIFWHRSTSDSEFSCQLFEYLGGRSRKLFQQYDFLTIENALDAVAANGGDEDAMRRLAATLEVNPESVQRDVRMCLEDTSMRIGVARILAELVDEGIKVTFDPEKTRNVISNLDALITVEDDYLLGEEVEEVFSELRSIAEQSAIGSVTNAGQGKLKPKPG